MASSDRNPLPSGRSESGRPERDREQATGAAEQRAGLEPERGESYGPLTIARHIKPDGRALILYTHAGGGQA